MTLLPTPYEPPPLAPRHGPTAAAPTDHRKNDHADTARRGSQPETNGSRKDRTRHLATLHLLRNSFRYAAGQDWDKIAKALKPVYTAPNADANANASESVTARIAKAVRARGHFPNGAAAMKCVCMALMSLDPAGKGRKW